MGNCIKPKPETPEDQGKGAEESKEENKVASNPSKKMEKQQEGSAAEITEGSNSEEELKEGKSIEEIDSDEKGEIAKTSGQTKTSASGQPKDSLSGEPIVSGQPKASISGKAKAATSGQNKVSLSGQPKKDSTPGEQVGESYSETSYSFDPRRDSRANEAAIRIQATYRGYIVRKKLKTGKLVTEDDKRTTQDRLSQEKKRESSRGASDSKERKSSEGKEARRKSKDKDKDRKKSKDKEKAKEKDKCKEIEKDTCKELAKAAAAKAIEKKKKKAKDGDRDCFTGTSKEIEDWCTESRIASRERFSCRSLINSIRSKVSLSKSSEKRDKKRRSQEATFQPRDDCCRDHENACGSNDCCASSLNVQNLTMLSSASCFHRSDDIMGCEVDCPVCPIVSQEPPHLVADNCGCLDSDRLTCPPRVKDLDCSCDNNEEDDFACGTYDRCMRSLDDDTYHCCCHDKCSNSYC